jgi:Kef-type K+ transport system membrane component KefB
VAVLTSHVSIIVPFTLASLLALLLYGKLSDDSVTFTGFALFMGSAMSITAFPVLARILKERNLLRSRLGNLTMACAAVDDVSGWCILAYVVALVRSGHSRRPVWVSLVGAIAFATVMIRGVRPLLARVKWNVGGREVVQYDQLALIMFLILGSALVTEWLGIHFLFGAFLAGAIVPKDQPLVREIAEGFEPITVVLLLPLYFAFTGLRTGVGLVHGLDMWLLCGAIIAVAITGKIGGCMIAMRSTSADWRTAAAVGVLMNTRGLMELVILNIGLDIGVISSTLFSMMVLMALVTTAMTTPLLEWVYPMPVGVAEWHDQRNLRALPNVRAGA